MSASRWPTFHSVLEQGRREEWPFDVARPRLRAAALADLATQPPRYCALGHPMDGVTVKWAKPLGLIPPEPERTCRQCIALRVAMSRHRNGTRVRPVT